MKGICKFFSDEKGFGFIVGEDNQDYFVHFKQIISDGFKSLKSGEKVEFLPGKSVKGLVAESVKISFDY